jgi:hypothetical protein
MTRHYMPRSLALMVALGVMVQASAAADRLPVRSTSQAGVTVKVQPIALAPAGWDFEVTFDTHSQELKDDLTGSAMLVSDAGAPLAPSSWKGDPPGGHHRKGVLRFESVSPAPAQLELRIQRAGEATPRVFRWQLKEK